MIVKNDEDTLPKRRDTAMRRAQYYLGKVVIEAWAEAWTEDCSLFNLATWVQGDRKSPCKFYLQLYGGGMQAGRDYRR